MKKVITLIFTIVIYIVMMLFFSDITIEKLFLILPQLFLILYYFYIKKLKNGPLVDLVNFIIFIRYMIIPGIIIIFEKNYKIQNFYEAYYMYFYEMICVILTLIFLSKKRINLNEKNEKIKKNDLILYIFILLGIILVAGNPKLLGNYNFLFAKEVNIHKEVIKTKLGIFIIWIRYILIYVITKFCYKKFIKTKKMKFYYYNLLVIILNMLVITKTSRFSIMIFLYIAFVLTKYLYKKNEILHRLYGYGLFILAYSTLIKFSKNMNFLEFFRKFFVNFVSILESYFGGLKNLSYIEKLSLIQENTNKLEIFLNDTFSSVMYLSKFTNFEKTTIFNFNYAFYNHKEYQDQIVPLSLQSYSYLGPIFFPLLSIIYIYILVKLDYFFLETKRLDYSYLIMLIGFTLANFMMTNHSIVFSSIVNLMPLIAIFFVNKKIKI